MFQIMGKHTYPYFASTDVLIKRKDQMRIELHQYLWHQGNLRKLSTNIQNDLQGDTESIPMSLVVQVTSSEVSCKVVKHLRVKLYSFRLGTSVLNSLVFFHCYFLNILSFNFSFHNESIKYFGEALH